MILVGLVMTCFSEKMLISTRCIHGFMSNLIKKSWTVSNHHGVLRTGSDWKWNGGGLEVDWKWTGSELEADWKRTGSGLEGDWKRTGSGLEADWKQTGSGLEAD